MDIWMIVALFFAAAATGFFTWQAADTGEIWLSRPLSRADSPSTFHILLTFRAALGVLCLAGAVWGIFAGASHG